MTYKALRSLGDIGVGWVGSHLTNGPVDNGPIISAYIWSEYGNISVTYLIQKKGTLSAKEKELICGVRVPWRSFVSSRITPCHNVYYATTCAIIHVLGHVPLYRNHRFPGA